MNRPTTVREALVAELIGDVSRLLDRAESLTPAIDEARHALVDAATGLVSGIAPFQANMAATGARTKDRAVEHIVARTNEIASRSVQEQTRAMSESARTIFSDEVAPTLRQLTTSLQRMVERADRPWDAWLTHAATAIVSGACSVALALYVLGK